MSETKIRQTEITIETRSLTIIRTRRGNPDFHFCQKCGRNVNVFAQSHAAFMFRVQEQFLTQLLETKHIHEANENALCGNSLVNYFK